MKRYNHSLRTMLRHTDNLLGRSLGIADGEWESDSGQSGFTIVELMIATTVFSMIMMVIVFGVLSFSHDYYGGLNASTTQDTARNVMNAVAQSIEFSGTPVTPTPNPYPGAGNQVYFCAGNATYVYDLGLMYAGTPTSTNPGLYMVPGACKVPSSIPTTNGKELLAPNMRVTVLTVDGNASGRLYTVTLGVAFGDSDLLCNAYKGTQTGGCTPGAAQNHTGQTIATDPRNIDNVSDVECRQLSGSQFCSHAGLSTTVALRVSGGALN